MNSKEYKIGQIVNGLKFLKEIDPVIMRHGKYRTAEWGCVCGKVFICRIDSVVHKNTKSCGCLTSFLIGKAHITHGLSYHPLRGVWKDMKIRCYNKRNWAYKYYGGRGIKVSEEFHDLKTWFDYVISLNNYNKRDELHLTLDRINNDGNYERGNLKWATKKEQSRNTRRTKKVINVVTKEIYPSIREAARAWSMNEGTLRSQLVGTYTNRTHLKIHKGSVTLLR